jgi:hypothetical protein
MILAVSSMQNQHSAFSTTSHCSKRVLAPGKIYYIKVDRLKERNREEEEDRIEFQEKRLLKDLSSIFYPKCEVLTESKTSRKST